MPSREKLSEFTAWSAKLITGDEKSQAQIFLDRLFQAFGQSGCLDVGGSTEFRIRKADENDGGTTFADYVWKPVVHVEMKKRGENHQKHCRLDPIPPTSPHEFMAAPLGESVNKAWNWADVGRVGRRTTGWLILFARLLSSAASAQEAETPTASDLRPFYVIGHGANSINEATRYLSSGVNALELDVNVYRSNPNELCIGHGPKLWNRGCSDKAPALADYLKNLHEVARTNTNLTLVYFDCKSPATTAAHGVELLNAIRTFLIGHGTNAVDLNVIVSVAHVKTGGAIFEEIRTNLGPTEALLVDHDRDTGKVAGFFAGLNVTNQCLGYGHTALNSWFEWRIHPVIKTACSIRSTNTNVRLVITHTVNKPRLMRQYIRTGVDGILVDRSPPLGNSGDGLKGMRKLLEAEGAKLGIRKASRQDHPFVRNRIK